MHTGTDVQGDLEKLGGLVQFHQAWWGKARVSLSRRRKLLRVDRV